MNKRVLDMLGYFYDRAAMLAELPDSRVNDGFVLSRQQTLNVPDQYCLVLGRYANDGGLVVEGRGRIKQLRPRSGLDLPASFWAGAAEFLTNALEEGW